MTDTTILAGDELAAYRGKAGQPVVTAATSRDREIGRAHV